MAQFKNFYHCSLTDSNQQKAKGGRTASEEARYLEEGNKSKEEAIYLEAGNDNKKNRRDDLAYIESGNIPKWSEQEAIKNNSKANIEFFKAADKLEPPGHVTHRVLKIALPEELTLNQNINLVKEFMKDNRLDDRPYTFAIHIKPGELSPNNINTHVHIMFSDRKIDGIERSKEQFFKQYRPKNPDKGGCKKDNRFSQRHQSARTAELIKIRKSLERKINEHYLNNGYDYFVSSDRKENILKKALERSDQRTADLAAIPAQKHLGAKRASNPNNPLTKEVLRAKAEYQRINDYYNIRTIEQAENLTNSTNEKINIKDLKTLQAEFTKISTEINQLKAEFYQEFKPFPEAETNFSTTKSELEEKLATQAKFILHDEAAIYASAVKDFCKNNNLVNEGIQFYKNQKIIKYNEQRIDGIEKQIINKHLTKYNKNLSEADAILAKNLIDVKQFASAKQRDLLETLYRQRDEALTYNNEFRKKYINPDYENQFRDSLDKVNRRNEGNKNRVAHLEAQILEYAQREQQPKQNPLHEEYQIINQEIKEMSLEINEIYNTLVNAEKIFNESSKYLTDIATNKELDFYLAISNLSDTSLQNVQLNPRQAISKIQGSSIDDVKFKIETERQNIPHKLNKLIHENARTIQYYKPRIIELRTEMKNLESKRNNTLDNLYKQYQGRGANYENTAFAMLKLDKIERKDVKETLKRNTMIEFPDSVKATRFATDCLNKITNGKGIRLQAEIFKDSRLEELQQKAREGIDLDFN